MTNAAQLTKAYTDCQPFDDFVAYSRWNGAHRPNDATPPQQRPGVGAGIAEPEFRRPGPETAPRHG